MNRICITGGAGFVASHLTEHFCEQYPNSEIIVVDKIGYASRLAYLTGVLRSGQVRLVEGCICDAALMRGALKGVDLVVHAAAESHVDNSYRNAAPFIDSNVTGTVTMLQAAIDNGVGLFFHVSTDEVYGGSADRLFTDEDALNPTNPYAASKASAEMFVHCYAKSYGLPTLVSRANNIFGTRQYPEKLIPKLICDALRGRKFQIHGDGSARRAFLHVDDFCSAVTTLISRGERGRIYNIPALREYSVVEVVDLVAGVIGISRDHLAGFGPDRPHNDSRYGVVGEKITALGWRPTRLLENELAAIVDWYRANTDLYFDEPPRSAGKPILWLGDDQRILARPESELDGYVSPSRQVARLTDDARVA
ncbi:MAG: GDP-mannose 4,6-dehydratase [Rhizobiaceae bacterium]|nr:GDP-mannose 4,6-dehydratase [Rhizobiaceae bacterium]